MTTNAKRKNRHKKAKSAAGTASTAGTAAARIPERKQQQQQQSTRSPPCYVDDSLEDDGGSCCGHTHAHVNDGEHMHGYNDTQGYSTHGEVAHSHHYNPSQKHRSAYDSDSNASNCWREAVQPDKNKLRQFWLQLPETSRRQLMVVEKDVLMSRMRQHQRRACRCEFCGVPK